MSRPDWCSRVENVRGSFGAPRPLPKRAEYVPKATERRPARAIVDSNKPKSMNAPIRKITQQRVATGVDVRAARISNAATRAQKRGPHKAVSKPPPEDAARAQTARDAPNAERRAAALAARRSTSAAAGRGAGRGRAVEAPRAVRFDGASTAHAKTRTRPRHAAPPRSVNAGGDILGAGGADSWMDSLDPKDWRGNQAFGDARDGSATRSTTTARSRTSSATRWSR